MVNFLLLCLTALIFLLQSPTAMTDQAQNEIVKQFDDAASQLVSKILKNNRNIKTSRPRLLFTPYAGTEVLDVPAKTLKKYHSIFLGELIKNGSDKILISTDDNYKLMPEARLKTSDYMVTSEISRFGETLNFNYRLESLKTSSIIDLVRIKLTNLSLKELDDAPQGISFNNALNNAADRLFFGSPDMKSIYYNFLKSEDKGFSTAFDRVFMQDLIQKLEERISNPLTRRKLSTVFRRTSKLKLPSGAYHLSGTSRISGQNIYVNITLKDKANRTTSWSGYITRSSLGSNLAFENLNYKNELEALRSTDRQGDLNLSLTTSFGDDPVLRFKDVWQLKVKVNKPAWLFCFYYMNNKETLQIYPNHATWQYFGGPKIPAGKEISIPRRYKMGEAKVSFVVSEPAGYELVKCFATTRDVTADLPAQLLGKDAIDMGAHKAPPVLTNEIDKILSNEFRRHSPNVAEASIAVTVISGK